MKHHIQPAVYIMASECRGTTYIGVTSNLAQRVWQHRNHVVEGFSERYHVTMLVWYELHLTMESAIGREKALKMWKRAWKFRLIETENSAWRDLWFDIVGDDRPAVVDQNQNGFLPSQE